MTIEEAKKLKAESEKKIAIILEEFCFKTGLKVKDVSISALNMADGSIAIIELKIKTEL